MTKNQLRRLTGASVLILAVMLSACGSSQSEGLLALEDIPNGFDGPEVLTVGADSASIRFDTGVPTVCNSPFGETTEYGEVATIPMFSGATLDHVVTFAGLDANTIYHYQIIATDNQGNVYRSGDFTFTTTAESGNTIVNDNWLSLENGAIVSDVSSNFGSGDNDKQWGANSAIDGSTASEWSSRGDGDEAFIEIQMAEEVQLSSLVAHTRSMANDTAQIFSFNVTTDKGETYGPFELPDADGAHEFEVDFIASTLLFEAVSTNGGNTGFVELGAFGTATGE
jgi:hypothetical protein